MNIQRVIVGPFQASCYVVWGAEPRALVIDPGADTPAILECLEAHALTAACYLLTHGHMDHIGALSDLLEKHPAPYALHALDLKWAFSSSNQMPPFYPAPHQPPGPCRILEDGQSWTDGGLTYRVLSTPGHSPGSVCFHFEDERVLFSGDTLFQGTVGRTDIPGGDGRMLTKSLRKLAQLPPETRVFPGHGAETLLSEEFRLNPFMKKPV